MKLYFSGKKKRDPQAPKTVAPHEAFELGSEVSETSQQFPDPLPVAGERSRRDLDQPSWRSSFDSVKGTPEHSAGEPPAGKA